MLGYKECSFFLISSIDYAGTTQWKHTKLWGQENLQMYTYLPSLERIVLEIKACCKCNKERGFFIGNTLYNNQM